MIEQKPQGYYTDKVFTPAEMDAAIAKEREACAKTCEELWLWNEDDPGSSAAKAIRARGQA